MKVLNPSLDARGLRVALVVSRFNHLISVRLLDSARETLVEHGLDASDMELFWVPGAFEIPLVARRLGQGGRFDAIVALGSVIRGGTPHFDYVCSEATLGLGAVARNARIPLAFGVLTTDDRAQALARAGDGPDNKGYEAAMAVMEMVSVFRGLGAD